MGEGMSMMAKRELPVKLSHRYRMSSKEDKTRILDEFIAVAGITANTASGCWDRPMVMRTRTTIHIRARQMSGTENLNKNLHQVASDYHRRARDRWRTLDKETHLW